MVDAPYLPTYSYVVQNLWVRLLLLISKASNLKIATGDVGNAHTNANCGEKVHSKAGSEWKDNKGCVLETIKTTCGLKTSARQWSSCLGDALREMGFFPSRDDPDLWMKKVRKSHRRWLCIILRWRFDCGSCWITSMPWNAREEIQSSKCYRWTWFFPWIQLDQF